VEDQLCRKNEFPDPIAIGLIHLFIKNLKDPIVIGFEKEMKN